MPRVLVIFEYPSLNGGERSFLAVLPELQHAGFQFLAVAPASGPLGDALRAEHVELLPVLDANCARDQRQSQLEAAIRQETPDLLHANSLSMSRLAGPVARHCGLPSIGHLRDILKLNASAVADLNCHARLLAVSEATRTCYLQQGLDATQVQVAYNGVDLQRFRPQASTGWLHTELDLPATARLIGGVGQIILRKGWDVWLDAAASVMDREPLAHFVLIGQRHSEKDETVQLEETLIEATRRAPWSGRLHLLGTRARMEQLLPELSVYAHAARQEPLGRVLLEAAACSVPVVATDVGGSREIFGDDGAILIAPDKAQELANRICEVLQRPGAAAQRARCARQRIADRFDVCQAADTLARHYRQVIEQR